MYDDGECEDDPAAVVGEQEPEGREVNFINEILVAVAVVVVAGKVDAGY